MSPGTLDPDVQLEIMRKGPLHEEAGTRTSTARRRLVEWAAAGAAFLVWLLIVLPARGGWQAFTVPTATLLLVPSLLALRPWRHCSRLIILLSAAPSIGALVVAALSPFGDGGPISLARWGYAGGLFLVTASFTRTPARQAAVVGALMLAALHQYTEAWLPWWGGGGSIDGPMVGTLYSPNPFGGLMLAFSLVAIGVALLVPGSLSRLGWLVAPLCVSGVILSGARAAMLLLASGAIAVAALALRAHGARGLLRSAALIAVCWAVLTVGTSSLFFTGDRNALAATASKHASGQTLDSTTSVRLDYWSAAFGQFRDHPVLGGGSGSYLGDSRLRMAPAAERSPFAHNELLGSLAEGGVVLGLPVLVLFMAGAATCLSRFWASWTRPAASDPQRLALVLGAGALMLHGLVDFALSFPAVLALLAVLLGAVVAKANLPGEKTCTHPATVWGAPVLALLAVVLCGGYLGIAHDRAGVSGLASAGAADSSLPAVRDGRVLVAQARALAADDSTSPELARQAALDLNPLARLDGNVEAVRLHLLAASGRPDEAISGARALAQRSASTTPLLLLPYAEKLAGSGDRDRAFELLAGQVHLRSAETGRVRAQLLQVLDAAGELSGRQEPGWSCTVRALQRSQALPARSPLVADLASEVDLDRCDAWALGASSQLAAPP